MSRIPTCVACNQAMLPVEPDQITHPCCDPDDTPFPALSETGIAELLGDLGWLRQQPGRCTRCGYHPATHGHAADCDSKAAAGFLFARSNQCSACGEPVNRPGLLTRCRDRHKSALA
jgi:hypothetical protein